MLHNYVQVAFRTLRRNKSYTLLNLAGLAVGFGCSLTLFLYVHHEWRYDRFHEKADRIYRITYEATIQGHVNHSARSAPPMGPALVAAFPEVQHATRFVADLYGGSSRKSTVRYGDARFNEKDLYFAEPSVFEVFDFALLRGDAQTALAAPNTMVITETMAQKYFGDADPLGKVLLISDKRYEITGLLKDVPRTSHLRFDALLSLATLTQDFAEELAGGWFWVPAYTYVVLAPNADVKELEHKLPGFYARHMPDIREQYNATMHFQALTDIHLHSHLQAEASPNGSAFYVYMLGLVAVLVLVVAGINYVNLTTAQHLQRAREVGVRKALGATRSQLVRQFLTEAMLACLLSLAFGVLLVKLALPMVNTFAGTFLQFTLGQSIALLPVFVGVVGFVGLLAGSYPAFFLSAFQPIRVLKGQRAGRDDAPLRKGLLVTQFAIALVLIIGTLIAYRQLDYLRDKDLGFNEAHVLAIGVQDTLSEAWVSTAKQALEQQPGVLETTFASGLPGAIVARTTFYTQHQDGVESRLLPYLYVDYDFLEMMDIPLVEGRNFSRDVTTDEADGVLINETAARHFGWEDPIGKAIKRGRTKTGFLVEGKVIGMVEDFHLRSLHEAIEPMVLMLSPQPVSISETGFVLARLASKDPATTLDAIRETWRALDPEHPFEFFFLDETFDAQYGAEEQLGSLLGGFATLAILIACLGLFGLAAFSAQQRTKEIGIRKVLGASVPQLVLLLSREFILLVCVAFAVAAPMAYFAMRHWLARFAYHVGLSWSVFLIAGLAALTIALLTVSYQAIKAALADPVDSLRYE